MLGDERFELVRDLVRSSNGEQGLRPQLDGPMPELVEAASLGCGDLCGVDVDERVASPELESPVEQAGCRRRVTRVDGLGAPVDELVEGVEIQLAGLETEQVAGLDRPDRVRSEQPAELRDLRLQRVRGVARRLVPRPSMSRSTDTGRPRPSSRRLSSARCFEPRTTRSSPSVVVTCSGPSSPNCTPGDARTATAS